MRVLAVDPGRWKCGVAVCDPEGVVAHRVVPIADLAEVVGEWVRAHRVDVVLVGNKTGFPQALSSLFTVDVPVRAVEERGTTLEARRRYFRDHPARGWRRFLPSSLQVPPEPHDDYAAIILAETYLGSAHKGPGHQAAKR